MKIAISAGHYPAKPGATYGDFVEHTEAVLWRDRIVALLPPGAVAVPVGTLQRKVAFINAGGFDLAVEVHFNDATRWDDKDRDGEVDQGEVEHIGRGSETLYYPKSKEGLRAATIVQDHLSIVFGPDRGAKEGWYRMNPAFGLDFFLARTECRALIVEPEFVKNAEKIRNNREAGCAAVAAGILAALRAG